METTYFLKLKNSIPLFIAMVLVISIQSCEEDLASTNAKKKTNFASQVIYNANILQRDSGFVKVRFKAPLIEKYELIDTPYVEAKKGIYIEFYDPKKPKVPGKIWAKYAKFIEPTEFYQAKGNVKVLTNDGQSFAMQSINWDKKNHKMYTSDTVFVSDKNGNILVGANGMEAKDDFSAYTFYNSSGNFSSKNISPAKR